LALALPQRPVHPLISRRRHLPISLFDPRLFAIRDFEAPDLLINTVGGFKNQAQHWVN
jgi:hypothetical protein